MVEVLTGGVGCVLSLRTFPGVWLQLSLELLHNALHSSNSVTSRL